MPKVFVSIGSNIERERNVRAAVKALRERFGTLVVSRIYESAAVGFSGDNFFNLVVGFDTEAAVQEVATALREIESANSRDRNAPRFSPRTLDLDLLLYDDLVLDEGGIRLPRAEIGRYAFVLAPLAEIAGDLHNPTDGRRFDDMWREFDRAGQPLWPVEFDVK